MDLLEHAVSLYAPIAFLIDFQRPQSVRVPQAKAYGRDGTTPN